MKFEYFLMILFSVYTTIQIILILIFNKTNSRKAKNHIRRIKMRCWQFQGLTACAEVWLENNCVQVVTKSCPNCNHPLRLEPEVISEEHHDSFYGEGPTLRTMRLKDGGNICPPSSTVKEVIQAEPWSSGPCTFLCLELEDGTRIGEWDQETVEEY